MLEYPQGNRFALSIADDRQAALWIASLLSLMYSFVILCTRLIIKWGFFALDDIALAGAYALSLAHWVAVYLALHQGLGKSPSLLQEDAISRIGKLVFTSRILSLASLGLSRCTVVALIAQLFTKTYKRAWMLCWTGGAVTAAWTLVAPLIVAVGCHPGRSAGIEAPATCSFEVLRWRVVAAIDTVLECLLVAFPSLLISGVQINRSKKAIFMLAFGFRIGNALLMIAFLLSHATAISDGSPSIGITTPLVWQEALVAYGLMSATFPVLKAFIGSFDTSALAQIDQSKSGIRSYRYGSAVRGCSSAINATALGIGESKAMELDTSDRLGLRPENLGIAMSVWHEDNRDDVSFGLRRSEDNIDHRTMD